MKIYEYHGFWKIQLILTCGLHHRCKPYLSFLQCVFTTVWRVTAEVDQAPLSWFGFITTDHLLCDDSHQHLPWRVQGPSGPEFQVQPFFACKGPKIFAKLPSTTYFALLSSSRLTRYSSIPVFFLSNCYSCLDTLRPFALKSSSIFAVVATRLTISP